MRNRRTRIRTSFHLPLLFFCVLALVAGSMLLVSRAHSSTDGSNNQLFLDATGFVSTYSTAGFFDTSGAFFQSLGTNGRSCGTCHVQANAMGLSALHAQLQFLTTGGRDPLFAAVDGANCPNVPTGNVAGHSLMLFNGLVRISLPVPQAPLAKYTISVVHDPYGCALVTDPNTGVQTISVYRRPLPATNLGFLSAVMFDGRETIAPLNNGATLSANLQTDLRHQAIDATLGHAQAMAPPTDAQVTDIVNFELGLFSAQQASFIAGPLNAAGATGGAQNISVLPYYPGINDPLGGNPTGAAFNPSSMTMFSVWSSATGPYASARQMVAAGEAIFDNFPLQITNVRGLNDALSTSVIQGTCTTCHDTPNVGNHSLPVPLDIGTSHGAAQETDPQIGAGLAQLSVPDLPIFNVSCSDPASPNYGQHFYTSDPGKALIPHKDPVSGNMIAPCTDINRIKGPILRGLAARAPFFHNGAAADLNQVVNFYNQRFQMGLTDEQKAELVAFLSSL